MQRSQNTEELTRLSKKPKKALALSMWSSQRHVLLPPRILSREPQPQPSASLGPMAAEAGAAADYTVSDLFIFHRKTNHSEPGGGTANPCQPNVTGCAHPLHASPRLPAAAAAGLRGSAPQLRCAGGADGSVPANSFLI